MCLKMYVFNRLCMDNSYAVERRVVENCTLKNVLLQIKTKMHLLFIIVQKIKVFRIMIYLKVNISSIKNIHQKVL